MDNYDGTVDFLRSLEMDKARKAGRDGCWPRLVSRAAAHARSQDSLTKAIIGTIGDIDSYQLPDSKGYTALLRYIMGVTDEERQQRREEILSTSLKDFRQFADYLECTRGPNARVVAVTSQDGVDAALKERPGFFQEVKKVL